MNTSSLEAVRQQDPILARFKVAQLVIRKAGSVANEYFGRLGSLTIKSKGSHDLVSEADVNTELLIRNSFREHFPDDSFFGEESGHTEVTEGNGIWVVDPIICTLGTASAQSPLLKLPGVR
jgi:myo-inositol-1(or 4)-monophosphatase